MPENSDLNKIRNAVARAKTSPAYTPTAGGGSSSHAGLIISIFLASVAAVAVGWFLLLHKSGDNLPKLPAWETAGVGTCLTYALTPSGNELTSAVSVVSCTSAGANYKVVATGLSEDACFKKLGNSSGLSGIGDDSRPLCVARVYNVGQCSPLDMKITDKNVEMDLSSVVACSANPTKEYPHIGKIVKIVKKEQGQEWYCPANVHTYLNIGSRDLCVVQVR